MDAVKRIKNLKQANWGPPLGGSFAKLREDLNIKPSDLTAAVNAFDGLPEDTVTDGQDTTS